MLAYHIKVHTGAHNVECEYCHKVMPKKVNNLKKIPFSGGGGRKQFEKFPFLGGRGLQYVSVSYKSTHRGP